MHRVILLGLMFLLVTGSAYFALSWLGPVVLNSLGVQLQGHPSGGEMVVIIAMIPSGIVIGGLVGLFLFPIIVRPFVTPELFWRWLKGQPGIKIPLIDVAFEKWCTALFGKYVA